MNKVLFKIGTGAFSFSHEKMLFHSFIACLFPFIILVEESVCRFLVILLAQISHSILLVTIVLGARNLFIFLLIGKVTFCSKTHSTSIDVVVF